MKYHVEFDIDFLRNPYIGLYIVFEGIDGSGKTTQVKNIMKYLKGRGKTVIQTREPRKKDGIISKLVQQILSGKTKISPVAFQYLFSADREMHHTELIIPSLKAGKTVVSDRNFWSSVPYGLLDRRSELNENSIGYMLAVQSILSMYHQFILPDYTFYLDISLETALSRLNKSKAAREIYEDRDKLSKIIKGYKRLVKEFPKEFIVIDGGRPVEEVTKDIINNLKLS